MWRGRSWNDPTVRRRGARTLLVELLNESALIHLTRRASLLAVLIIGNMLSVSRALFALWCIMAAPLMMGNDLRNLAPEMSDLTNAEVIAVDQIPSACKAGACTRTGLLLRL